MVLQKLSSLDIYVRDNFSPITLVRVCVDVIFERKLAVRRNDSFCLRAHAKVCRA